MLRPSRLTAMAYFDVISPDSVATGLEKPAPWRDKANFDVILPDVVAIAQNKKTFSKTSNVDSHRMRSYRMDRRGRLHPEKKLVQKKNIVKQRPICASAFQYPSINIDPSYPNGNHALSFHFDAITK